MLKIISGFSLPSRPGKYTLSVPCGAKILSIDQGSREWCICHFIYPADSGKLPAKDPLHVWIMKTGEEFEEEGGYYWGALGLSDKWLYVYGSQNPQREDLPGSIQTNEVRPEPHPFPDDLDQPKIKDIRREDQEADNKPFKVNASFTDPAGEVLAILRELPTGQQNTILNQVLTLIIVERKEIRNKLYEEYMGAERSIEALNQITKGFTDKIAQYDDKEQA